MIDSKVYVKKIPLSTFILCIFETHGRVVAVFAYVSYVFEITF